MLKNTLASLLSFFSFVSVAVAQTQPTTNPASVASTLPAHNDWVWVEADRKESLYAVGDWAQFHIRAERDGKGIDGPVDVEIFEDGVSRRKETLTVDGGSGTIRATLDHPGFVRCAVTFNQTVASGGAGFSADQIKPAASAPKEFDAFWADQKRQLKSVEAGLRMSEVESGDDTVICFEITANSAVGQLRGYMARPRNTDRKWPAMVTIRGGGVFDSQKSVAVNWAHIGMIVLDWNIHGLEHGKGRDYYLALREGELKDYATRGRESREDVYFRGVILRMLRAIDVVCAQPQWDGKHLVLSGASQGGGLAIIGGGLDPRVSLILAQVPGLCDITGVLAGRANGWPRFIANAPGTEVDPKVVQAVNYYDAAHFAARYKGESLLTVGFIDSSCFPTGAYAAFNQLSGKKRILNLPWLGHTLSPQGDGEVWQVLTDHLSNR